MSKCHEEGVPDGMKLDSKGNLYSTGLGGIWIISVMGDSFARIYNPEVPSNLA